LERKTVNNKEYLAGYHTQEFRVEGELDHPIRCDYKNAWLGSGYYFWTDIEFAQYWGEDFKVHHKEGCYDIYSAEIDTEKCLNAVFNEQHYFFFRRHIDKAINHFRQNGQKVTLKRVHDFLSEIWEQIGVTGIIYDDLPANPKNKPNRKYSVVEYEENRKVKFLYYKKRIQIVVFNLNEIYNFSLFLEEQS